MCLFNFFQRKGKKQIRSVIFHRKVFTAQDNVRCLITIKVIYVKKVSFRWTRRAVGVNSVCISCRRCSQTCLVLSKRQPWKYRTVITVCFQECPCLESCCSFIINNEDFCSPVLIDTRNYLIFCLMKWYISGESDATVFEESDQNTDFKLKTRHH